MCDKEMSRDQFGRFYINLHIQFLFLMYKDIEVFFNLRGDFQLKCKLKPPEVPRGAPVPVLLPQLPDTPQHITVYRPEDAVWLTFDHKTVCSTTTFTIYSNAPQRWPVQPVADPVTAVQLPVGPVPLDSPPVVSPHVVSVSPSRAAAAGNSQSVPAAPG